MKKRPGSELRDTIAEILRIRFSDVETEYRIGTTTADIFFIDDTSIFPQGIAVECKDWTSSLSSSKIAEIFNLYFPSMSSGQIDKLLIVSRHELGIQPSQTINELPNTAYQTFDQFVHSQMNFGLLLQSNIAAFKNHEASDNFIQPRIACSKKLLFDAVDAWLCEENSPVSMVFGGYGLGKTSFSHYLASQLTIKYRQQEFDRIPIRISLGGLFTKQDLKAVICSELTGAEGQPAVKNFSYELFLNMLETGAVFLILDGFDEMRHAMTKEDFSFTFEQMSPLFRGNSKAIILGRPDAFFDEDEEVDVIGSLLSATDMAYSDMPKFEVDRFSREEVDEYLNFYCDGRKLPFEVIEHIQRLSESEYEILSRPVQANMFTKVMTTLSKNKSFEFSRYDLYFEFIRQFSRREEQKPARSLVTPRSAAIIGYNDPRSIFMQNIAWWINTVHKENRFVPYEIPANCLPDRLRSEQNREAAIREALVGSVVEHDQSDKASGPVGLKGSNNYYFPHKSYIEFLVSQYFCRVDFTKETYRDFFAHANPEMLSFVREGPAKGAENIAQGLQFVLGNVSRKVLEIGCRTERIESILLERRYRNLSEADTYMTFERLLSEGDQIEVEQFLIFTLNDARSKKSVSTSLRLTGFYLVEHLSKDFVVRLVANAIDQLQEVHFRNEIVPSAHNFDSAFVHSSILGSCISKGREGSANFMPGGLLEAARLTADRGMWCSEFGGEKAQKREFKKLPFQLDEVSKGASSNNAERAKKFFSNHELLG